MEDKRMQKCKRKNGACIRNKAGIGVQEYAKKVLNREKKSSKSRLAKTFSMMSKGDSK